MAIFRLSVELAVNAACSGLEQPKSSATAFLARYTTRDASREPPTAPRSALPMRPPWMASYTAWATTSGFFAVVAALSR